MSESARVSRPACPARTPSSRAGSESLETIDTTRRHTTTGSIARVEHAVHPVDLERSAGRCIVTTEPEAERAARWTTWDEVERYRSGQPGQTVNLLAFAYGGSNPPLSTISHPRAQGATPSVGAIAIEESTTGNQVESARVIEPGIERE